MSAGHGFSFGRPHDPIVDGAESVVPSVGKHPYNVGRAQEHILYSCKGYIYVINCQFSLSVLPRCLRYRHPEF
jgi:hypothetical protein